jgi:predicted TIM-barrel fold metal-dependent hydrolase
MPNDPSKQTVSIKPGQNVNSKTGEHLTVIIQSPRCIADSHAHIENGACAPLPLLWDQSFVPDVERKTLNGLAWAFKNSAGNLQVKSTTEIGNCAVKEIDAAFRPKSDIGKSELYKNSDLYSLLVIQMMDMEYAHITGFNGQTIYHDDKTPWYYYERRNGKDPENNGKKVVLPGENQKTFAKWEKQYLQTTDALKLNPLRLIAMYHYEPRRWNYPKSEKLAGNYQKGPWDYPFKEIATSEKPGLFIGFKIYPPLGYKPLDERLPYLHDTQKDADCFYARCEREGIPIMTHCSPGGMMTHEREFYMEHDTGIAPYQYNTRNLSSPVPTDAARFEVDTEKMASKYFYENYAHPKAWRKVLEKFPRLRLCLAHFGGKEWNKGLNSDWVTEIIALTKEYPNVYTDFSCWDLDEHKELFAQTLLSYQYSHLKDKILFGTDWYMTLLVLGGKSYQKFCEEFYEYFLEIPGGIELWQRFTFTNPFTFYGFFDKDEGAQNDKLDNLVAALKAQKCKIDKLKDNLACFRRIQLEFDRIKKAEGK